MIERKTHKSSINTSKNSSKKNIGGDLFISSVTKKKEKSASETASSILEELGVKKTSLKKQKKNSLLNVSIKEKNKISQNKKLDERGASILKDLKKEKIDNKIDSEYKIQNKKIENEKNENEKLRKNKSEKYSSLQNEKFGFHEKFILFILFILIGYSFLAFIGGYIKLDLTFFRNIFKGKVHQLEFLGEFRARQVENGYNRIPLFVVEGNIRNSFYETDNIQKIQLKAFAFDQEQRLIENHFTYTGVVFTDEQLENLSPINIKALRQTGDLSILKKIDEDLIQSNELDRNSSVDKDIPFQVIFFKDVSAIKSTSIEIVSYVRNGNLIFLGSHNRN